MIDDARHAAERVARVSYGRMIALIAARTRDITAAEDALADAFAAALRTWPRGGVPDRPEAWLLTAARRVHGHDVRHVAVRQRAGEALRLAQEELDQTVPTIFPDRRLALMFVCAHPAVAPEARTPLTLQTVLGLDAARIAAAFLTTPAAMGQRLVRAKAKIRDTGVRFAEPDAQDLPERLDAVLSAVYAAYGVAWDDASGGDGELGSEAIYLARLLVELMPDEPEPRGLLALILYCESRAAARRTADGGFVPLGEQNPRLWSRELILEAEGLLTEAARAGRFGRFQTEAAIQSVHAQRGVSGRVEAGALVRLYDLLVDRAPSTGASVARAAAHGEAFGAAAGVALLDALPADRVLAYQPYWAARGHLLVSLDPDAAADAYERAIALTADHGVAAFLRARQATLAR